MKLLSIFTVAASFVVGSLAAGPRPHHHHHAALTVRGGAKLGPLDAKLAVDLSKAAATAYAAGSASKYINKQVGGKDTEVRTIVQVVVLLGQGSSHAFLLWFVQATGTSISSPLIHPISIYYLVVGQIGHR
jgi:hypothetical protein